MGRSYGRRAVLLLVLATLATMLTSGCGLLPPEGARDVVERSGPMRAAALAPRPGVCYAVAGRGDDYARYRLVACHRPHLLETVYVGSIAGDESMRDVPPSIGSPARLAARAECDLPFADILGDEWRAGLLRLLVVLPSEQAWRNGARWFRCDLGETTGVNNDRLVERAYPLHGALASGRPLALGCFTSPAIHRAGIVLTNRVDCLVPHQAEFVGTYVEEELSYAEVTSDARQVHARCRQVLARAAGLPIDDDLPRRAATVYSAPLEQDWSDGDRTIRCLVWRDDPPLTRSVHGGGTSVLPVPRG
ncbi:septum formation family protein [Solwaraspora sp. WMMB335]|uniref:septum formation family protein n=1 Tax=Solwaraspora sp. WMMB335 TaxID=3404118 RepID=UPI003B927955